MLAFSSGIGTKPKFLAIGEPTTGLAPTIVDGLVDRILEVREGGASILWVVEKDPLLILPHVDRVYVLSAGTGKLMCLHGTDGRLLSPRYIFRYIMTDLLFTPGSIGGLSIRNQTFRASTPESMAEPDFVR